MNNRILLDGHFSLLELRHVKTKNFLPKFVPLELVPEAKSLCLIRDVATNPIDSSEMPLGRHPSKLILNG